MTALMTIPELRAKFGTNDTRLSLLDELDAFVASLRSNFSVFRLLVFGSFITSKELPSDIDVMAYVLATPEDPGFNKFLQLKTLAPASIDVFTLHLSMSFGSPRPLPAAESMIAAFNSLEAHVASGTACQFAVELVDQTGSADGP